MGAAVGPAPPLSARPRREVPNSAGSPRCTQFGRRSPRRSTCRFGAPPRLIRLIGTPSERVRGRLSRLQPGRPRAATAPGSPNVRPQRESAHRRPLTNPYKGLRPFAIGDSLDFFGRDDLIRQMLDTCRWSPAAAVGPSGAGKSSLVSAGVLPALRRGDLPGAERWFVTTMVPGSDPFEELEAALLDVAVNLASLAEQLDSGPDGIGNAIRRTVGAESHLLIVIDQFEELYTQCPSDVADRFIEGVWTAVSERVGPKSPHVIVTLHADFFDRPLSDQRLAAVDAHTVRGRSDDARGDGVGDHRSASAPVWSSNPR